MDDSIQRLLDSEAIRQLVYRYSYCIDTNRQHEFLELFTEDCVFDPGPGSGGEVRGREAVFAVRARSSLRSSSHHNGNVMIDFVDAHTARLRTSFHAWHRVQSGSEPLIWGYYEDKVVKQDDRWLFAERRIQVYGDSGFGIEWNPGERV